MCLHSVSQAGRGSAASNPGLQGWESSPPFFTSSWGSLQWGCRDMPPCSPFVPSKARWHRTGNGNHFFHGGDGDLVYSGGRRLGQHGVPQCPGSCAALRWPQPRCWPWEKAKLQQHPLGPRGKLLSERGQGYVPTPVRGGSRG